MNYWCGIIASAHYVPALNIEVEEGQLLNSAVKIPGYITIFFMILQRKNLRNLDINNQCKAICAPSFNYFEFQQNLRIIWIGFVE